MEAFSNVRVGLAQVVEGRLRADGLEQRRDELAQEAPGARAG